MKNRMAPTLTVIAGINFQLVIGVIIVENAEMSIKQMIIA